MGFVKKIQEKLSDFSLSKKRQNRRVKAVNLKTAKSIGIIYDAEFGENFELVKRYVKFLKENGSKVKTLGFFDKKELPIDANPKLEFDFICKKDLNLRLQPEGSVVENFIEESFDILIDVSLEVITPIKYILTLSNSTFKVGAACVSYSNEFDLSINIKEEEGCRILMKNIDHYLHSINKE